MLKIESLGSLESPDNKVDEAEVDWLDNSASQRSGLVITKLTGGVKDVNRVNVFVNGKYTLSLDVKQIIDLDVKVGQKLSEDELQKLHEASEFGKLYQRALEWALTRPHSVWETRDYLKRCQMRRAQLNKKRIHEELKPLPEIKNATMDLVIERLMERGYIDDKKFAEFYVENRFVKKGVSARKLELELRQKHVADGIIKEVLDNSPRDETEELNKVIAKKCHKYGANKLIEYLVKQGFNYQLVKEAVAKLDTEDE